MKKYVAFNLTFTAIYTTLFVIFVCGNEVVMTTPWWVTLLAAIIPSVLTGLVTLYCCKKSYIGTNTEELRKFARQLGLNDHQTLDHKLSSQYHDISKSIGKSDDDKTLTGQHKDMQVLLEREIQAIERRYIEEEKRIERFTAKQHEISRTIKEFELFMESWKRLVSDNHDLHSKIRKLESENQNLRCEMDQLRSQQRKPNTPRRIR